MTKPLRVKTFFRALGATFAAMLLVGVAQTLFAQQVASVPKVNGDWLIDLRTLCAVGSVVLGGTWWMTRWLTRIEMRLSIGEERFGRIEDKLNILPCSEECPSPQSKRSTTNRKNENR